MFEGKRFPSSAEELLSKLALAIGRNLLLARVRLLAHLPGCGSAMVAEPGVARYRSHASGVQEASPEGWQKFSDCLSCQHVFARSGLQGELVFNIELRIVRSFRIHAVIATIFGFPAVSNRW